MPNYIKPTFNLSSNAASATVDPGPLSWTLNLSTTHNADASGRLTVDLVDQQLITCSTSNAKILDGSVITGLTSSGFTPGSIGCHIYMKNTETSGTNKILVAIVNAGNSETPTAPNDSATTTTSLDNPTHQSLRSFTLNPGEFAFFPFDYIGDIYVEASAGSPKLEYWRFDRG